MQVAASLFKCQGFLQCRQHAGLTFSLPLWVVQGGSLPASTWWGWLSGWLMSRLL